MVTVAPRIRPLWAGADLPPSVDLLDGSFERYDAPGAYAARICAGVDTTRDAWRRRLLGRDGVAWATLATGCVTPEFCDWVVSHHQSAASPSHGLTAAVAACEARPGTVGPSDEALRIASQLTELGFEGVAPEYGDTPLQQLVGAGVAVPVAWDRASQRDPEASLHRLAGIAGIPRIAFRVVPPSPPAAPVPGRRPRTTLMAWHRGERFRTLTEDFDRWQGLGHFLGLINAVLQRTESPVRVAAVESEGRLYGVVGPPERFERLEESGLVTWAPAPLSYEPVEEPTSPYDRWRGTEEVDTDTGLAGRPIDALN